MSDYWKVPGYPSPKISANPRIKSNTKPWCQCFHISICCSNAGILQWLGHHIACWMSCRNLKWATNKKNTWLSFNFNYKVRHIIVITQVPCFFRLLGSLELPPPQKKKWLFSSFKHHGSYHRICWNGFMLALQLQVGFMLGYHYNLNGLDLVVWWPTLAGAWIEAFLQNMLNLDHLPKVLDSTHHADRRNHTTKVESSSNSSASFKIKSSPPNIK